MYLVFTDKTIDLFRIETVKKTSIKGSPIHRSNITESYSWFQWDADQSLLYYITPPHTFSCWNRSLVYNYILPQLGQNISYQDESILRVPWYSRPVKHLDLQLVHLNGLECLCRRQVISSHFINVTIFIL